MEMTMTNDSTHSTARLNPTRTQHQSLVGQRRTVFGRGGNDKTEIFFDSSPEDFHPIGRGNLTSGDGQRTRRPAAVRIAADAAAAAAALRVRGVRPAVLTAQSALDVRQVRFRKEIGRTKAIDQRCVRSSHAPLREKA